MASYIGKNVKVKNNRHTCTWLEQLENRMNAVNTSIDFIGVFICPVRISSVCVCGKVTGIKFAIP